MGHYLWVHQQFNLMGVNYLANMSNTINNRHNNNKPKLIT